jgi:hypothetical protein
LEDYERALKGFKAASTRDPGLHAEEEVEKLVKLLTKLEDATKNKVTASSLKCCKDRKLIFMVVVNSDRIVVMQLSENENLK